MQKWIDHIVVRVKNLDETLANYDSKLGLKPIEGPKDLPHMGMRAAIMPLGDSGRFIELAEPLGEGGAIGSSLEKRGEGVHLVALAVDDLAAATADLKAKGTRMIESGSQVFIHPGETNGVMYQLIERK